MNDSEIIDALGGTDKVAVLSGLKKSAISQWRKRGIPLPWWKYLKTKHPKLFRNNGTKIATKSGR